MPVPPITPKTPKVPNQTPPAQPVEPQVGSGVQKLNGALPSALQLMGLRKEKPQALDYLDELASSGSGLSVSDDDVDALIGSITFAMHQSEGQAAQAAIKTNFQMQAANLVQQEAKEMRK